MAGEYPPFLYLSFGKGGKNKKKYIIVYIIFFLGGGIK